ncbi:MAG: sigma-54 dependent transcriptional regulator [candidate division KSB1 bacterium]|nr:sigma-54 dependent transcriptional regulator [candidate division KSB1 bacterium]
MTVHVLVADDEPAVRFGIREFLKGRSWQVTEAATASELWAKLAEQQPDVVVLDHRLPDGSALDILRALRERIPWLPVIVLTGFGTIQLAVEAIQLGAKQFLTKPVDLAALAALIERVDRERRAEAMLLANQENQSRQELSPFLGTSEAIRRVEAVAKRVAQSHAPVLLLGETGTGKGVLARWLHAHGPRGGNPFVDLNCAALGGELLQAELFGYERGAFTGADARKLGLVELAHRGTLFLDEMGEMDPGVQAKLLKVLEEQRFRRLGGVVDVQVDVRLISATHLDLAEAVKRRAFRADLYYRIAVVSLELPPLRQRRQDILPLAEAILRRFQTLPGSQRWALTPDAQQALVEYDWPGNIRELRNVLERATLLAREPEITADQLALNVDPRQFQSSGDEEAGDLALSLAEVERRHILKVLEAVGGDVAKAAEHLQLPRSTLYQRLHRYGVRRGRQREQKAR